MAEDWFTRCADIINMDLTQPSHVRVVDDEEDLHHYWVDTTDGLVDWEEMPDFRDETTNTDRDYELTIRFDALTELEARLLVSAVRGFILRRTTAVDPVFITDLNPQGVTP